MANSTRLSADQRSALVRLKPLSERLRLYLAGGTAVAFHLGHRVSRDLDLFSVFPDLDLEVAQTAAVGLTDVEVLSLTDAALRLRVAGIPVDIVRYPFPLLNPTTEGPDGIATASIEDLVTMKLSAAVSRGIRRDFWDLDEIFSHGGMTLASALDAYTRRFGVQRSEVYHVLRALTYFDDADKETVMPEGLTAEKWSQIKASIARSATDVLRDFVAT